MRRTVRSIALTLILSLPFGALPSARAQDADSAQVERAENYAAAAYDAYMRKDYAGAVALYRKALESAPSADITYNLARIYDTKMKNRTRAIEYYGRYVADPGGEPSRVQAAMERLVVLREQQRIASGETLPPSAASTAAATAPAAPLDRETGLTAAQVVGAFVGALGAAGIATGAGFGIAAKAKADVAHSLCDGNQCSSRRGVDAAQRASDMALVSTAGFIAGGALVIGGVALLVFGGRAEREVSARSDRPAPYTAWVDRHSFGVQLAGQF